MEKILKYSALIYALLIFLGYSYIDNYYGFFGIQIYSYLDASEILLSFLKNLNLLLILVILAILINVFPMFFYHKISEKVLDLRPKTVIGTYKERNGIVYGYIWPFLIMLSFIYCIYNLIQLVKENPFIGIIILIVIVVLLLCYLVYYSFPIYFEKRNIKIDKKLLRIALTLIAAYLFNFMYAYINYTRVFNKIGSSIISFKYESNIYKTSDSIIYVGSTSKYLFLKNCKSDDSYIFEKESIKNLTLHNTEDMVKFTIHR